MVAMLLPKVPDRSDAAIAFLEDLLERAKAGDVLDILVSFEDGSGDVLFEHDGLRDVYVRLGRMRFLEYKLLAAAVEEETE